MSRRAVDSPEPWWNFLKSQLCSSVRSEFGSDLSFANLCLGAWHDSPVSYWNWSLVSPLPNLLLI